MDSIFHSLNHWLESGGECTCIPEPQPNTYFIVHSLCALCAKLEFLVLINTSWNNIYSLDIILSWASTLLYRGQQMQVCLFSQCVHLTLVSRAFPDVSSLDLPLAFGPCLSAIGLSLSFYDTGWVTYLSNQL